MSPYPAVVDDTVGGTPWHEIRAAVLGRQTLQDELLRSAYDVQERYNGDWVLPEFSDYAGLSPDLIHDAVEHTALTARQVTPMILAPPTGPGPDLLAKANMRRKGSLHTLRSSRWELASGRFFRQLGAYGTSTLIAWPDHKLGDVRIQVRDAITSYPEPKDPSDFTPPANIAFVTGKSAGWLRANYPQTCQEVGGCIPRSARMHEEMWDTVQWWDEEAMVIGILGPRWQSRRREVQIVGQEIARAANRAGICPGISPWQVTLDRVLSHIARITGKSDLLARFTALDMIASEKAIFPDRYILGNGPGNPPRLVDGNWIDGRTGGTNLVTDAQGLGELRGTPDPSGKIAADRIERNARATAGLVAPFQGETYGALRTGRGIESLMEASVDPRIHEIHTVAEWAMSHVLTASLKVRKGWWGSKTFSFYSGLEGDQVVESVPNDDYDDSTVEVKYPIPGTDIQGTTIVLGQLKAADAISQRTFMSRHPWVTDAEAEERQLLKEQMSKAAITSLTERFLQGIHPLDQAELLEMAEQGKSLAQLIKESNRLSQERQAAEAPPPEEGMAMAPEQMPGLGDPGEGGEMQAPPLPPAIAGPTPSQANLRRLTLALKTNPRMSA